jgi:alginate O-acetyltransferase complex protein AlgI
LIASERKRAWLVAACVWNISLLSVFKYAAMFVASVLPVLETAEISASIPDVLLPLGISFYTLQILGMTIDTYRGRAVAVESLREYALFVSFFPQLIAGPILRSTFIVQLRAGTPGAWDRRGLWLIASGLLKKVVFADFLLAPFVNPVFAVPEAATASMVLMAIYSFTFQIYFDFSGYTDIARGLARLLGFELPLNFREPFLSRNPAEFWRRWHISLSQWLRDYLYIPLGGNRGKALATYFNLMLTMLISGLWHGSAWTFVVWGGLHGLLLVTHRLFANRAGAETDRESLSWRDSLSILVFFHFVAILFVLFRADGLENAVAVLGRLFLGSWADAWPTLQTAIVVLCGLLHVIERAIRLHLDRWLVKFSSRSGRFAEGAIAGALVVVSILLGGAAGGQFIYFQF